MTKFKVKRLNGKLHKSFLFQSAERRIAETPNYVLIEAIYTEAERTKPTKHFIVKKRGIFGENFSYSKTSSDGIKQLKKAQQRKDKL